MPQMEQLSELGSEEQECIDGVVETLATPGGGGENVAEVAHDVRNMVTTLDLYCDLLQQPGVLAAPFTHYGGELRLVAAASRRLVEKLSGLGPANVPFTTTLFAEDSSAPLAPATRRELRSRQWRNIPAVAIRNLAEELLACRNLLAALAGPDVAVTIDVQGGCVPVRMTSEDLTRILVNLVKNATEAMSGVGRIHITLWESCDETEGSSRVTLNVEDNGPGLPERVLERIFEPQPALKNETPIAAGDWPSAHHGLGLSITRSLVEGAGGLIHAANRDPNGACFQIELPVSRS